MLRRLRSTARLSHNFFAPKEAYQVAHVSRHHDGPGHAFDVFNRQILSAAQDMQARYQHSLHPDEPGSAASQPAAAAANYESDAIFQPGAEPLELQPAPLLAVPAAPSPVLVAPRRSRLRQYLYSLGCVGVGAVAGGGIAMFAGLAGTAFAACAVAGGLFGLGAAYQFGFLEYVTEDTQRLVKAMMHGANWLVGGFFSAVDRAVRGLVNSLRSLGMWTKESVSYLTELLGRIMSSTAGLLFRLLGFSA
eukprot:TRINITY_DN4614_c0_g2_i1.p1 TRINITY_DN4614_c0_g2~~TRINITY_DN4614_c0_g2_i1.p1  ORF type:complete len:248 (-),score=56.86 TRINITY_DN4614_c0_g2_i1:318-1061(-)